MDTHLELRLERLHAGGDAWRVLLVSRVTTLDGREGQRRLGRQEGRAQDVGRSGPQSVFEVEVLAEERLHTEA